MTAPVAWSDSECVDLLRWALPSLGLHYEGYRRVRRRVCRRLRRRLGALGLADAAAYRRHLEGHPAEWDFVEACCRLPISRFYRDRRVFDRLRSVVLPTLARAALTRRNAVLRAWSAGCAAGEEVYSLAACFVLELAPRFPGLALEVVATDADASLLDRARRARYAPSSAKELPEVWREALFERLGRAMVVRPRFRRSIRFALQDLRRQAPSGPFDLVLCRNVAFTYFDATLQRETLARIAARLVPGGALVIGRHERLPDQAPGFVPWPEVPSTFLRLRGDERNDDDAARTAGVPRSP